MSAAYNNQWDLGRSRWRGRAPAADDRSGRRPATPLQPQRHDRQPAGADERPPPPWGGVTRKRPRWIDRDT